MMTNLIQILAILAMMEQGPNLAHDEHGAWCLKSSAIKDVHKLYPSITSEEVDASPVASKFCAGEYWKLTASRLTKRLGRAPTDAEVAGAFNAGVTGWMRGDGRGYAARFENLEEANAPHQARAVASRSECGCSPSGLGGKK